MTIEQIRQLLEGIVGPLMLIGVFGMPFGIWVIARVGNAVRYFRIFGHRSGEHEVDVFVHEHPGGDDGEFLS